MSVLLLSGGLDSAVCAAYAKPDQALFVDYGQPHAGQERLAATRVALYYDIDFRSVSVTLPLAIDENDPGMVIPGRNLFLLALAAMLGGPVIIGANLDDRPDYVDCRPEFFDAAEPALNVAIKTPLLGLTKPEIGQLASELGVPVESTWSCYYPVDDEHPCGQCDACKHRAEALA